MSNETNQPFRAKDLLADWDTTFRFIAVLGLQMGQIFPAAFIGLFLPVIFRQQGLALDMYWVFTLPAIPTWIRPLWAPFVDRTGSQSLGMRKSWFIPCTVFGAFAYLSLTFWAPDLDNLAIIITILVIKTTFMTTQDIAIDGYMVENIRDEERAVGAAVLDIGRNTARFIAWAGIAWIYTQFGWTTALMVASALLIMFSTPGVIRREPPRPRQFAHHRPSLARLLKRPDSRYIFPLCFMIALLGGLLPTLYPTYLVDLGFSLGQVAAIAAPATLIGTVIGASTTSWYLGRFGYKTTILTASFMIIVAVIPIVWMGSLENPTFAIVFAVTLNAIALPSFLDVSFQAARLKWASKSQAATDYTSQIVTMTAGGGLAVAVGGVMAEHLGWFYYFLISGSLISVACFVLYRLFDTVENLVEIRDLNEADELNPQTTDTTGPRTVPDTSIG
ncbi:MAG: MFS transporter [Gammaproteobacteria bacterium]|nr:MFS transporter [Gammaproteobacteria bacterium]